MSRRWQIELPFTAPMSLNHRDHWRVKAKKTAEWRAAAKESIELLDVPAMPNVRATVAYAPRDARRRDPINLIPTLKACEDGMVDAGVVPDDTPEFVESLMPSIEPKQGDGRGWIWLVIEEA